MTARKQIRVGKKFNICITQKLVDDTNDEWLKDRYELTERVFSVVYKKLNISPKTRVLLDFVKSMHGFTTMRVDVGNTSKPYVIIDPRIFDYDETSNKTEKRWFVEVLCHELIHIKQQETGRFRLKNLTNKSKYITGYWYGKEYKYGINDNEGYWNAPWEKEARTFQVILANYYFSTDLGKQETPDWPNVPGNFEG